MRHTLVCDAASCASAVSSHARQLVPELFACRRVRLLVDSANVRDFMKMFLYVQGLGEDFRRVRYFGKVSMELLRFVQGLHI